MVTLTGTEAKAIITTVLSKTSRKQNILNALTWIAKETKSTTKESAMIAFVEKCVNDFDEIIKYNDGSYMIKDKTDAVDCIMCLIERTSAMTNYINTKLV